MVVAGRARAVVVGVGANTAMGSIRDFMLQTEDVKPWFIYFILLQIHFFATNVNCLWNSNMSRMILH